MRSIHYFSARKSWKFNFVSDRSTLRLSKYVRGIPSLTGILGREMVDGLSPAFSLVRYDSKWSFQCRERAGGSLEMMKQIPAEVMKQN